MNSAERDFTLGLLPVVCSRSEGPFEILKESLVLETAETEAKSGKETHTSQRAAAAVFVTNSVYTSPPAGIPRTSHWPRQALPVSFERYATLA